MKKLLLAFVILTGTAGAAETWRAGNKTADSVKAAYNREDLVNWNFGLADQIHIDQGGLDRVTYIGPGVDGRNVGWTRDSVIVIFQFDSAASGQEPNATGDTSEINFYTLKRTWGEGNNTGAAADAGECSWDSSVTGTTAWQTGGARGANDRGSLIDSIVIPFGTAQNAPCTMKVATAYYDSIVDYGMVMEIGDDTVGFSGITILHSDDEAAAGDRGPIFLFYETEGGAASTPLNIGTSSLAPGSYAPNQ